MGIRLEVARRGWSGSRENATLFSWLLEMGASQSGWEGELAGRHRPRHPPVGGGAALDPGRAADRLIRAGWWGIPTPTWSATRWPTRSWARPAWATSASITPTPIPQWKGLDSTRLLAEVVASARAGRVAGRQLRRHRPRPGAEARPAQAGHPGEPRPAARGRRDGREREGQDRRARRPDRPRRGDRLRGRHPHRAGGRSD